MSVHRVNTKASSISGKALGDTMYDNVGLIVSTSVSPYVPDHTRTQVSAWFGKIILNATELSEQTQTTAFRG
jgi:hypothetical protein